MNSLQLFDLDTLTLELDEAREAAQPPPRERALRELHSVITGTTSMQQALGFVMILAERLDFVRSALPSITLADILTPQPTQPAPKRARPRAPKRNPPGDDNAGAAADLIRSVLKHASAPMGKADIIKATLAAHPDSDAAQVHKAFLRLRRSHAFDVQGAGRAAVYSLAALAE